MKEFTYTIKDEQGILARPASDSCKIGEEIRKFHYNQQRGKNSGCNKTDGSYGTLCKMWTGCSSRN